MYKPNPECYGAMFAVPASVADEYLAEASGNCLKALLLILRNPGKAVSVSAISERLGLTADDVLVCLDFWVQKGILLFTDDAGNVKYVPKEKATAPLPPKPVSKSTTTAMQNTGIPPVASLPKPTIEQIATRIQEDKTVRSLLSEAQSILGRTIGLDMQSTLLTLFDTYGLSKEVILTLVQHLTEHGRGATANVLRIGKLWAEREINTLDAANEYIQNDTQINRLFTEFRTATGISNPRPTQKQSDFLLSWTKMELPMELLLKAYEETVERTGKLSFAYMDKILKNWYNAGLKSDSDVEKQKEQKAAAKRSENTSKRSYDLDDALSKILNETENNA